MEPKIRGQSPTHLLSVDTEQAFQSVDDSNKHPSTKCAPFLKAGGSMSPPPRPDQSQVRPLTFSSRPNNRLSLSLPIQAADRDFYNLTGLTPTSSNPSTRQASPAAEVAQALSPDDSGDFLVALAAQERRVLELKEELSRAESELKRLKRRWAVHEAGRTVVRSRAETKNEELRPMQAIGARVNGTGPGDEKEISTERSLELDRRKAILAGGNKDSRRKVIRGGHTRALSLLSPVHASHHLALASLSADDAEPKNIILSSSKKDISQDAILPTASRVRNSYQDSATSGVKQIAEDIKSGLWSFMEDLRQATVGDEAVTGMPAVAANTAQHIPGKKSGASNPAEDLHRCQPQSRMAPKSWRTTKGMSSEAPNGAGEQVTQKTQTPDKSKSRPDFSSSLDDDWSHWDSPVSNGRSGRWSNSTTLSSQDEDSSVSPVRESKALLPNRNASSTPKRGEMPWPDLNNLTPSNLKRTASAIIKEWEKSLTPPTEDRKSPISGSQNERQKSEESETRLILSNLP